MLDELTKAKVTVLPLDKDECIKDLLKCKK
jgi:hypothetical protein